MRYFWVGCLLFIQAGIGQPLDARFHSYDEIQAQLSAYDSNPDFNSIFRLDTIGYSNHESIPIIAGIISNNVNTVEDEPRLLFIGQVHAEEILGVEAVLELINRLLYPEPVQIQHVNLLRQTMEIWLIPTMNPEGMGVVFSGDDVTYRKNKTDFSPGGMVPNGVFDYEPSIGNDIDGVDINRNFDFNWVFGDTFLQPDQSAYGSHYDYFRGPSPFSESGTRALRDLAIEKKFMFSVIWHSSRSGNLSEQVFTSWEWEDTKYSPDWNAMITIGDHLAELIENENGTGSYLSIPSSSRNGKAHDWFYRQTGCFQYLIECGTENIQPDSALIEDTVDRIVPAMFYLMDRAIGYNTTAAQINGIVSDIASGSAIEGAEVSFLEMSNDVLKPRVTDAFGRYRRVVNPGTYTILVSHPNYFSEIATVTANNSIAAQRNFALVAKPEYQLNLNIISDGSIGSVNPHVILTGSETDTVPVTIGNNTLYLREGQWSLILVDENSVPIQKTISLTSDNTIFMTFGSGSEIGEILPTNENMWTTITGDWQFDEYSIRSQSDWLYANSDTSRTVNTLVSRYFPAEGVNRIVAMLDHRYELEWEQDSVIVNLISNSGAISSTSFSNHHWNGFSRNYITLVDTTGMDSIKIELRFSKDETVNYRGWEIDGILLKGIDDNYVGIAESSGNSISYTLPSASYPYPNPSNGTFRVDLENWSTPPEIVLYNILGQEVLRESAKKMSDKRHLWIANFNNFSQQQLATGVYFIRISNPERTIIRKCVFLNN